MRIATAELLVTVEAAFARRDPRLAVWPDPHPDRPAHDEEYSRVTDPGKWRILGARADAWVRAVVELGLAEAGPVELDAITWTKDPATLMTSAVLVRPAAPGALPLIVARSRIDDVPDAGVTLGLGLPSHCVGFFPDCGCDACDTGAAAELDVLDQYFEGILTGSYRRLARRREEIVVIGEQQKSWTGELEHADVTAILGDPHGWRELSGGSWLA
jgi:hypothetical protein